MNDRASHQRALGSHRFFKLIFLIALTVGILESRQHAAGPDHPYPTFLAALAVTLAASGWAVVLTRILPLPVYRRYYRTHPWERQIYQRLGIRKFKRMVNSRVYRKLWGPALGGQKEDASLNQLAAGMRQAETSHLLALTIVFLIGLGFLIRGEVVLSLWLLGCNLLINLYPVMLQRYNRQRISHIQQHRSPDRSNSHCSRENRGVPGLSLQD